MKIAYATTFDTHDVSNWSGTPFYMSQALEQDGNVVEYVDRLKLKLPPFFKLKQIWKKFAAQQRESPRFNIVAAKYYSEQVAKKINQLDVDVIIAPQINPIAYLDCKKPIVLWTDGLYASLLGFYPGFSNHSASTIAQGNAITQECLSRCRYAIFSSDWGARTAIEIYGVSKEKIKVIPFGANLQCHHTTDTIRQFLKMRPRDHVKLLFLGKNWERKNGEEVIKIVKALHESGQKVELNFVGCRPPRHVKIPDYIKCHGFVSKKTKEGMEKITRLLQESHFLFVPSRSEAYGIVFCEANAFGLPCLTSYVGGISTVVKNNINGMTFGLDATPDAYCNYISNLMQNYAEYENLALSSFNEYTTRLNWQTATRDIMKLIEDI